jgi:hypothetical protein
MFVINKDYSVSNKHFIANIDARTDKGVTLHLAVAPNPHSLLNLDEWANPCVVSYLTPVQVGERLDNNIFAKADTDHATVRGIVHRTTKHLSSPQSRHACRPAKRCARPSPSTLTYRAAEMDVN